MGRHANISVCSQTSIFPSQGFYEVKILYLFNKISKNRPQVK